MNMHFGSKFIFSHNLSAIILWTADIIMVWGSKGRHVFLQF
jgi:hypothetical protein